MAAALVVGPAWAGPKIIFLDVGQGDCILVQCPGNNGYILIDCGSALGGSHGNNKLEVIRGFLTDARINIKTVVITHADIDHYNQVDSIWSDLANKPGKIIIGGMRGDYQRNQTGKGFLRKVGPKKEDVEQGASKAPGSGAWFLEPNFREPEGLGIVSCSATTAAAASPPAPPAPSPSTAPRPPPPSTAAAPSPPTMIFQILMANYYEEGKEENLKNTDGTHVNERSIVLEMKYTYFLHSKPYTVHAYFMGDAEKQTELAIYAPHDTSDPMDTGGGRKKRLASSISPRPTDPTSAPPPEKKVLTAAETKPMETKTVPCLEPKPVHPDAAAKEAYTLLKVGHHGSENGTSDGWLNHIREGTPVPVLHAAIISARGSAPFGHPRCDVLKRLDPTGGACKNAKNTILCYATTGVAPRSYNLNPAGTEVHSTHLKDKSKASDSNDSKGAHYVFDLEKQTWEQVDTVDNLKKKLFPETKPKS